MEKPRTSIPVVATAAADSATGGQRHQRQSTKLGQDGALVQEKVAVMQMLSGHGATLLPLPAPASLTLSLQSNSTGTPMDEEPDSPTSPSSCTLPDGYSTPLIRIFSFGEYGSPPPPPVNREILYNPKSRCTASPPMDALLLQRSQDDEPSLSGDLESGDIYPPDYSPEPGSAVRQDTEFAEIALRCHNDDPSNEVKYELIEATMSNFMFEGSRNYGHVNFTARAKQDGSEEELFFAELNLRDSTTLTCFCSLKEMEDQIGGRTEMEMDTEAIGVVDLDHCYACDNALKHPRDGASYQAGHRIGPRH